MKHLITWLMLTLAFTSTSQHCPELGPDQLLPCGITSTTLTADLSQCGAGSNPNQTTGYSVAPIPYVAQTNTGTSIFMTDDSQQGPFNIGFTFCFFGQTYTQFYIGSNGWISFSAGQPVTFTSQPIPTPNALVPKNCILGPWQDWHPGVGGQIKYQTSGTAPCRKLTVSWTNMPMYSCTSNLGTFHIVIYESTNYIENHIQNKPACLQWQGGTATEGIHNATGTAAVTVPGRNSTAWTTTNNSYRYTPNGAVVNPILTWYQVGNPIPIATGVNTVTVTPPPAGASYTCHFVYPICNAGWSTCNLGVGLGPDTVFVQPGPPNLPPPIVNFTNPVCASSCTGTIDITPIGANGVATIIWNTQPPNFNLNGLCSGSYNFTITDAFGCTIGGSAVLVDPLVPVVGPITYSDTLCYGSTSEMYVVPNLGLGYNYIWSTVGSLINQGNDTCYVDWTGVANGFIPGAVQVTAVSPAGCSSLPVSIDLYNLLIVPTIDQIGPFCSYDTCTPLTGLPIGGFFTGVGVLGTDFCPGGADTVSNTVAYTHIVSGCFFETTSIIDVYMQPTITEILPANGFFEICEGDSITQSYNVNANLPGNTIWSILGVDYNTNPLTHTWNAPGTFIISVTHTSNGCVSGQQQTSVTVARCPDLLLYIPNTFTPDGDEHNNSWRPVFTSGFDPYDFQLTVYNRWGETIFQSFNALDSWDATYNNTPVQSGVYTWLIQYGDTNNDSKTVIHGSVTLIR
jgi:gliding motility-associated-like protein